MSTTLQKCETKELDRAYSGLHQLADVQISGGEHLCGYVNGVVHGSSLWSVYGYATLLSTVTGN